MKQTNKATTTMSRREIESSALDISKPNNPFSEILLNGDRDLLTQSLIDCGWSGDNTTDSFDVKVVFNGVDVSVVDFNTIVQSWWDRAERTIKEQTKFYQSHKAAERIAGDMVQEKLDKLQNIINSLQNCADDIKNTAQC